MFHGLNLDTGEIMAVKQVLLGPASDAQKKKHEDALRREMELLEEMDHQNIVRYLGKNCFISLQSSLWRIFTSVLNESYSSCGKSYDGSGYEITDTKFNVFLEYVSGGSVASCLSKFGKFDENLTRSMTCQILCGLEYLHMKSYYPFPME